MASPRKYVTQATTAASTTPKGKVKAIEAAELEDHQTNLSDVQIHDDEDSHSSLSMSRRVLATEPKSQHPSEQFHQMLFNLKKQMEDQQAKMNRLCETATLEKDTIARIHTRLLKQVDTLQKSRSSHAPKAKLGPHYHQSMTGNPHSPLATRGVTGQRPPTMTSALRTLGVTEPRSSLA